jgi:hypothetical protein
MLGTIADRTDKDRRDDDFEQGFPLHDLIEQCCMLTLHPVDR